MSDAPESLILVYLRRLDAKMGGIQGELRAIKSRLGLLGVGMSVIRREIALLSES
jgi:hypothetical protein